jgi:hypothetical protein
MQSLFLLLNGVNTTRSLDCSTGETFAGLQQPFSCPTVGSESKSCQIEVFEGGFGELVLSFVVFNPLRTVAHAFFGRIMATHVQFVVLAPLVLRLSGT